MSELKLRELGRWAEEAVILPDLGALESRGRALRVRRQVGIVAAATLLAVTGAWLLRDQTPQTVEPAPPIEPGPGARPYPGPVMEDLEPGTYELFPSRVRTEPSALVTVPRGWNSWQGPNRFGPQRPGDTNEQALPGSTWYADLLIVKITAVADTCEDPHSPDQFVETSRQAVDAIKRIPGYRFVGEPVTDDRFGYPATHFVLRALPETQGCPDYNAFGTSGHDTVGVGERADLWVVAVDGSPLMINAGTNGEVPPRIRAELAAMVDSIEFVLHE
jgi:hypothetical protein